MGRVSSKRRPAGSTAGPLKHPSQKPLWKAIETGVVPLNNLNKHYSDTDGSYVQSEDPPGFIYRTYSAARRDDHEDKPVNKRSNQVEAYVSSTIGGSLSQISFQAREGRNRTGQTYCGGIKGRVRGFSRVSRRNLLRKFASINRTSFRTYKGRVVSVTLTYPHVYPEDPEACKRHLKSLCKRLKRRFGDFAGFWRMGIQRRGACHFHLLLFVPSSPGLLANLRYFVSSSWYEVCGKVSEGHLLAGTRVDEIRTWRRATSYAERYMAKEEEFPEGLETGRIWGVWSEQILPMQWETVKVSLNDAFRIRRVYRRLARRKRTSSLHRITVFIRYENVLRLLVFLGYRHE